MPQDKNGVELKVGDEVRLRARVIELSSSANTHNCTFEILDETETDEYSVTFNGDSRAAEKLAFADVCGWCVDLAGVWCCTKCKNSFVFDAGGPRENRFIYCPCCGRKIVKELENDA